MNCGDDEPVICKVVKKTSPIQIRQKNNPLRVYQTENADCGDNAYPKRKRYLSESDAKILIDNMFGGSTLAAKKRYHNKVRS